jgi:Cu(I)/Ag(I) efflux system periplasmic protein CusF
MKSIVPATALVLLSAFSVAPAMPGMDHKSGLKDSAAQVTHRAVGVVKSADAKAGTVLMTHEPVKALNWPAMTMSFKVAEPATFARLVPGQRVEFEFQQRGRDYVVTSARLR